MTKKLKTMVDFILESQATLDYKFLLGKISDYAIFLKTPINIGMFVPAVLEGEKWIVLEEPSPIEDNGHSDNCECIKCLSMYDDYHEIHKRYQQAKKNVIFEGKFFVNESNNGFVVRDEKINLVYLSWFESENTIEDLVSFEIEITDSKAKELGL